MYITSSKTVEDWKAIRVQLEGSVDELLWRKAFTDFFWGRIQSRYFEPIEKLREHDAYDGYGFTILTLLCSLVEFLESTYKGHKYVFCKDSELKVFEYNKSKQCFVDFLTTKKPFDNVFTEADAKEFYSSIRCGLLHEASTKNGWRVWASSHSGSEIICSKSKTVYRDDFESAIKKYINSYSNELASKKEIQEAFLRKFDALCE